MGACGHENGENCCHNSFRLIQEHCLFDTLTTLCLAWSYKTLLDLIVAVNYYDNEIIYSPEHTNLSRGTTCFRTISPEEKQS